MDWVDVVGTMDRKKTNLVIPYIPSQCLRIPLLLPVVPGLAENAVSHHVHSPV
jgi:hypothetical protein